MAHYNLGMALHDKYDLDGAIACYKKALDLEPSNAGVHNNLGRTLAAKGDLDGAIACFKKALDLEPNNAMAHNNLGNTLTAKHDLDGAIACYKKALDLEPNNAGAHINLGSTLAAKGDLDGAIACYKKGLDLEPKNALAHYNLGNALSAKGKLDAAMDEYHEAIRHKPDYAEAYCNLGNVLRQQSRFEESLACYKKGHELGSKQPGWRYPSAQWVRDRERDIALSKKLPAILKGQATPANPGEAAALAQMCQQPYKKRYAASARLYADAFAAEPKLAADLNQQHRYSAACSAALAASGQGEDAGQLPDKVVCMFRRWVFGWLRDDLIAYSKLAEQNNPALKQTIPQRLTHWRSDPDLISVREPEALERLSEHERAAWQALWRDVNALLSSIAQQAGPPPAKP
jgi:tetratricopeptide (TPR) repeat protein